MSDALSRYSRREFQQLALAAFAPSTRHRTLAGVRFEVIRNGRSKTRAYLLIHGNEQTAREVLREHMKAHRGTAHLVEQDTRMVPVGNGGKLDPNRLFSRAGAERNLKRFNSGWSDGAIARELHRLDRERGKLIAALLPPRGGLLVTLHNNSEGYSVKDEIEISNATSIRKPDEPHEFFLATAKADFEALAKSPYNVVLQSEAAGEDDGSLSRLMAARGVRYVNLEVELGKRAMQHEMLNWLEENVP